MNQAYSTLTHGGSAKELEHYQRVRRQFEGPSKSKKVKDVAALDAIRKSAPTDIEGLRPSSLLPKRPKPPTRNSTSIHRSRKDSKSNVKGKGKGRAAKWNSDDNDDDDDDDEAYVTSNDFTTPEQTKSWSNGTFGLVGGEDDSGLYR